MVSSYHRKLHNTLVNLITVRIDVDCRGKARVEKPSNKSCGWPSPDSLAEETKDPEEINWLRTRIDELCRIVAIIYIQFTSLSDVAK